MNSSVASRPRTLTIWQTSCYVKSLESRSCLSPYGASNLCGRIILVVWSDVLIFVKEPDKFGWTKWSVVLSSARPLFGQVVPSFPQWLMVVCKVIFPTLGENLSVTLSYLLLTPLHQHVMLISWSSATRKIIVGSRRSLKLRVVMFPSSPFLL